MTVVELWQDLVVELGRGTELGEFVKFSDIDCIGGRG